MKPAENGCGRRGYVLTVLIVVAGIVLAFALLMARLTVLETARQRQFALETWADEIVASARDWSRLHAADLAGNAPVRLPLDDLLPRGLAGEAEVERDQSDGETIVRCRITLEQARMRWRREVVWPLRSLTRAASAPR